MLAALCRRAKKHLGCSSQKEVATITSLDYSHSSLIHVPEEIILHERTLETLLLGSNHICELPKWLYQCSNLIKLDIGDNEFDELAPAIGSLTDLEEFSCNKNSLSGLPDNIKCCKKLRILDASINPFGRLPDGIMMLLNLRELYLNDCLLEFIPGSIGRLTKIKILELRDNRLRALPKSVARLVEIEQLDLGGNFFEDFPEVVCSLKNLTELWLDNNRLQTLSPQICKLSSLTFLDASLNDINLIPDELGECVSLTHLYLNDNALYSFPDTIGNLTKLIIFRIDRNVLETLSPSIGRCSSLRELSLNSNRIEVLPSSIGLLRKLEMLNVDENCLKTLTHSIGSCISIRVLSLQSNEIDELPDEIGRLSKLHVLNVIGNRLTRFPCSLIKLKELRALWISENQMKSLPPLQQEKDKTTGSRYLGCYLLPQALVQQQASMKSTYETTADTQSKPSSIRFSGDVRSNPSRLKRIPTPYPKDLGCPSNNTDKFNCNESVKKEEENVTDVPSQNDNIIDETLTAGKMFENNSEATVRKSLNEKKSARPNKYGSHVYKDLLSVFQECSDRNFSQSKCEDYIENEAFDSTESYNVKSSNVSGYYSDAGFHEKSFVSKDPVSRNDVFKIRVSKYDWKKDIYSEVQKRLYFRNQCQDSLRTDKGVSFSDSEYLRFPSTKTK